MPRAVRLVLAFAVVLLGLADASRALACTVCTNPRALISEDVGPRKKGIGLRTEVDFRFGSVAAGDVALDDRRLDLEIGYLVVPRVEISADASVLERTVSPKGGMPANAWTPGDVELRATGVVWSRDEARRRQSIAMWGGTKLPTAPEAFDPMGEPLSAVLQPGCNAVTPFVALGYAHAEGIWGFDTSVALYMPIAVRDAPHAAESVRGSFTFELRPHAKLRARSGIGTRFEPSGELAPDVPDPNSGGLVGTLSEELAVGPFSGWEIRGGLAAPVLQLLHGEQRLSTIFSSSVVKIF